MGQDRGGAYLLLYNFIFPTMKSEGGGMVRPPLSPPPPPTGDAELLSKLCSPRTHRRIPTPCASQGVAVRTCPKRITKTTLSQLPSPQWQCKAAGLRNTTIRHEIP